MHRQLEEDLLVPDFGLKPYFLRVMAAGVASVEVRLFACCWSYFLHFSSSFSAMAPGRIRPADVKVSSLPFQALIAKTS